MRLDALLANAAAIALGIAGGTALRGESAEADPSVVHATAPEPVPKTEDAPVPVAASPPPVLDAKASAEPHASTYTFQFSRPFVVPVGDGWRTQNLVMLSLAVELERGAGEDASGLEARMRDRITASLIELAQEGLFEGQLPTLDATRAVRGAALEAVSPLVGEGARAVLVTDMVKRPV